MLTLLSHGQPGTTSRRSDPSTERPDRTADEGRERQRKPTSVAMGEVVVDVGDPVNSVAIQLSVICMRKTERLLGDEVVSETGGRREER